MMFPSGKLAGLFLVCGGSEKEPLFGEDPRRTHCEIMASGMKDVMQSAVVVDRYCVRPP